jgi:hypothetical protein
MLSGFKRGRSTRVDDGSDGDEENQRKNHGTGIDESVSFRGSCISRQRIVRRYEKANSESRKSDEAGPGRSFTAAGRISAPLGWLMKELFGLFYDIGAVSFYLYII